MTIADILAGMHGVWNGTYTLLKPDGTQIERFASRQEGRMEGTDWTEKVVYLKDGQEPHEMRFHAIVDGDSVQFQDTRMWGSTVRAADQGILFTFGWHDRPNERIVELSMRSGERRTRLWQHFAGDTLTQLTVIDEERVPGAEPDRWFDAAAA